MNKTIKRVAALVFAVAICLGAMPMMSAKVQADETYTALGETKLSYYIDSATGTLYVKTTDKYLYDGETNQSIKDVLTTNSVNYSGIKNVVYEDSNTNYIYLELFTGLGALDSLTINTAYTNPIVEFNNTTSNHSDIDVTFTTLNINHTTSSSTGQYFLAVGQNNDDYSLISFSCFKIENLNLYSTNHISMRAGGFSNCIELKNITFEAGCTGCGNTCVAVDLRFKNFVGCTSLESVKIISNKNCDIGSYCFKDCTSLTSVSFLYGSSTSNTTNSTYNTNIYDYAFAGCTSLKLSDITGLYATESNYDDDGFSDAISPLAFLNCIQDNDTGNLTTISSAIKTDDVFTIANAIASYNSKHYDMIQTQLDDVKDTLDTLLLSTYDSYSILANFAFNVNYDQGNWYYSLYDDYSNYTELSSLVASQPETLTVTFDDLGDYAGYLCYVQHYNTTTSSWESMSDLVEIADGGSITISFDSWSPILITVVDASNTTTPSTTTSTSNPGTTTTTTTTTTATTTTSSSSSPKTGESNLPACLAALLIAAALVGVYAVQKKKRGK